MQVPKNLVLSDADSGNTLTTAKWQNGIPVLQRAASIQHADEEHCTLTPAQNCLRP